MLLTDSHKGVPKVNALREASSAMAFQKRKSTQTFSDAEERLGGEGST